MFPMKTAIPPAPMLDRVDRITSEPGTGNGPNLAHRAALRALLERAATALPIGSLEAGTLPDQALTAQINAELKERATTMQAAGQLPEGITVDQLVAEARRELCELGPIGPLLADDDVVEVHVRDHERVLAFRKSRKQPTAEMSFSSEAALGRTLQRLSKPSASEDAQASTMTFRTAEGVRVVAVAKGPGYAVVLRKPQRAENATIEELVRSGLISRVVATLLQQCMAGRANVLVTGAAGSGHAMLLAALAQTSTAEERVVALQDEDEIALDIASMLSLPLPLAPAEGARVARAAMQMRPDRLVVSALHGAVAAEVILGLGEGGSSLLAGARAPTLRHALARLTTQLVASKPGLDVVSARESLASSFDLVLEVARLRDGRARLVRLAELAVEGSALVTRDIFTFTIERTAAAGAIEGSLHPTGTAPMLVEDLAVRGVAVDPAIFRRAPGRSAP
jgi:pilus assembly protein CpaF